jgi:hypothetical protein
LPEFMAPVSGKTSSTARLQLAPARFLLQAGQVEHGGDDGGYGEARGGICRRRRPESVGLGFRNWGKCEAEEEESELGFVLSLYTALGHA